MPKYLVSQLKTISFLSILFASINGELTVGPSDVYGVTGSTVTLHCSTNLSVPVQWDFRRVGAHPTWEPWSLIYFGYPTSKIAARYRDKNKYSVTVDSTGNEYNLMIYNLQADDAGTYRCIDDYGFGGHKHDEGIPGHEYMAEIVLIGNLTSIQSINDVQMNITSLEYKRDDEVKLGCSITYVGNIHPGLLWSVFTVESGIETIIRYPPPNTLSIKKQSGVYGVFTSKIEINSTMTGHFHIKCNLTKPTNQILVSGSTSNSVSLQLDWIVKVKDTTDKRHTNDSQNAADLGEYLSKFIGTGVVAITVLLGILLGALIGILMNSAYLLKKFGYRITLRNLIRFNRGVNMERLTENLQKSESLLEELLPNSDIEEKKELLNINTCWKMIENMTWVAGISVMDDQMFVIRNKQPGVKVYDANTLDPLPDIDIQNMKKPRAIVACFQNKSLYISDHELQCIHIFSLNDKSVKSWAIKYDSPQGLSMTKEGNILLAIWQKPPRILEYTTKCNLVRNIELDGSIDGVYEAVKLSNDQFAVFNGIIGSKHPRLSIISCKRNCIINCEGKIIRSCIGEKGQGVRTLYLPCSLAIDPKRDIVFVADCGNHRVLMFDRDLIPLRDVKLNKELQFPTRVYFDAIRDVLIIGDATGGFYQANSTDFEDNRAYNAI